MIRNYRQIAKTGSNLVAWGSGRSQVISPVRDAIAFKIIRLRFQNPTERVTNYIDETVIVTFEPVEQYFDEESEFV